MTQLLLFLSVLLKLVKPGNRIKPTPSYPVIMTETKDKTIF